MGGSGVSGGAGGIDPKPGGRRLLCGSGGSIGGVRGGGVGGGGASDGGGVGGVGAARGAAAPRAGVRAEVSVGAGAATVATAGSFGGAAQ